MFYDNPTLMGKDFFPTNLVECRTDQILVIGGVHKDEIKSKPPTAQKGEGLGDPLFMDLGPVFKVAKGKVFSDQKNGTLKVINENGFLGPPGKGLDPHAAGPCKEVENRGVPDVSEDIKDRLADGIEGRADFNGLRAGQPPSLGLSGNYSHSGGCVTWYQKEGK